MKLTHWLYIILIIGVIFRVYFNCRPDYLGCRSKQDDEQGYYLKKKNEEQNIFAKLRNYWIEKTYRYFPSPHSELLLGMTVGVDRLSDIPRFKQMLRRTGTIHVVVVSGYNVSLVYNLVIKMLGSPYKTKNIILGLGTTLLYALLSGFEPPVVRAWLMGSVVSIGKYYGRQLNAIRVLFLTALTLMIINPIYLFSLSFQLSFLATLSLVLFESNLSEIIKKLLRRDSVISEDLSATLAAQTLIWPFLAYKFGQVSLVSPIINALILWTVPLATLWGGAFLLLTLINSFLAKLASYVIFLPLDFFAFLVRAFSKLSWANVDFQLSLGWLVFYYLAVAVVYFKKIKSAE